MTILLHKMQWSGKQMSYCTELKDRKKDDFFLYFANKKIQINYWLFPLNMQSQKPEGRFKEQK